MTDQQATTVPTYGDRLKTVRRFFAGYAASDGYDGRKLSKGQKSAITKKFNQLQAFEEKAFQQPGTKWVRVKARRADQIEAARSLGPGTGVGYPKGLRGWAVVAVPGEAASVSVNRRGVPEVMLVGGIRLVFERYDPIDMAADPLAVARDMQRLHPNANGYAVRAGEYGWAGRNVPLAWGPEFIEGAMVKLMYRYGADIPDITDRRARGADLDPENPSSNFYGNWVTGMVAFYMPEPGPDAFLAYVDAVKGMKEARKRRRRSKREKLKGRQG